MDKQQKIRDALKDGALSGDALKEAVGFSLRGVIVGMLRTGEARRSPAGDYELTPGWTAPAPGERPQRAKKKRAKTHRRKAGKKVRKARAVPGNLAPAVAALSEQAFTASARYLAATIRDQAEDIESNVLLAHALSSFELADKIRTAAHGGE